MAECAICGAGDEGRRCKKHRTPLVQCERCERYFCGQCLQNLAVEFVGMRSDNAAHCLETEGPAGLLFYCEECQENLCPECYEEDQEEKHE